VGRLGDRLGLLHLNSLLEVLGMTDPVRAGKVLLELSLVLLVNLRAEVSVGELLGRGRDGVSLGLGNDSLGSNGDTGEVVGDLKGEQTRNEISFLQSVEE
jgi:hypothetical protein